MTCLVFNALQVNEVSLVSGVILPQLPEHRYQCTVYWIDLISTFFYKMNSFPKEPEFSALIFQKMKPFSICSGWQHHDYNQSVAVISLLYPR
jgi:hypothetical protein